MIGWLLDTNVIAEIISPGGSTRVKQWAAGQAELTFYLSILTIAEYDKGIANLPDLEPRRDLCMASRDGLVGRFSERLLPLSNTIVRRWGELAGTVRRSTGHPPPVIDAMLAATALEHELYLVTRNIRDVRHSGAALFNPWEDDPGQFPLRSRRQRRS